MADGLWLRQRTLWLPTWRTCLLVLVLAGAILFWGGRNVHGWLCPRAPVEDAKYVVIEGWAPDLVIRSALEWSKGHETRRIFTTGMEVERGGYLSNYPTYADLAARTVVRLGADESKVMAVPASAVRRERTRTMAAALKTKLDAEGVPVVDRKINLFTLGTHARRSQIHFQAELGKDWQVGIVSVANPGYPEGQWWKYSEGAKSVISELAALLAQCLGGE